MVTFIIKYNRSRNSDIKRNIKKRRGIKKKKSSNWRNRMFYFWRKLYHVILKHVAQT